MSAVVAFWLLAVLALLGAAAVVFSRDALRLVLGLGVFLLSVAGYYLYYGMGFLAAAEVFIYVGGVLVMMLFALMLLARDTGGRLLAPIRFDFAAASVGVGIAAVLAMTLRDVRPPAATVPAADVGAALLGPFLLPAFELLGALLLAALVATLLIVGGGERS